MNNFLEMDINIFLQFYEGMFDLLQKYYCSFCAGGSAKKISSSMWKSEHLNSIDWYWKKAINVFDICSMYITTSFNWENYIIFYGN